MKRLFAFIFIWCIAGCCSYKNAPIIWYSDNEIIESLGVADEYCIYDFSSPIRGVMDHYESIPAHYQILLPPRKKINNILYGPSEDRCFFYSNNRGIAIIQDLHDWERKYENGLTMISAEMVENQLYEFEELLGKRIKVKEKRNHYMYVDNEIRIIMYNLTEDDYYQFVEFPLANLKFRQRGKVRLQEQFIDTN